ncbi:MAG TPA: hypothetical protein DEP91_06845 [Sphingomonas bacterium]|uniref:Uncharacterized protein n=1 Tax=Sphingomonas bacterium TaxID=1895847 RepID=A0A3D0WCZ8_9SPHN|nr:hypothetical protein [Sphingomonas bacterium]
MQVLDSPLRSDADIMERLEAALTAQTVDAISSEGNTIRFVPEVAALGRNMRPAGDGWMFTSLGRCSITIGRTGQSITADYHLNCRGWFYLVTAISLAVGTLISHSSGPDHEWGWVFALGLWSVVFASGFVSKTIEFRRWLKANLGSETLLPAKKLRLRSDP